jgi:pyrophosphatase PpaX
MTAFPFAVLFDLDGTLVDSIDLLVASMEHAFAGRALRPPRDEWIQAIGTPLDGMLARWAEGPEDVQLLRARYREYQFAHHDAMTHAYPGAVDAVRALHAAGHPLAVVTSKLEVGARRSLRHVGIEECFTAVVGIDATDRHKPDPAPVHHALGLLGVPHRRAIFIGDSTHDMHAGRSAGVFTGAALWGPYSRALLEPTQPSYWLQGMPDVPPLIETLRGG